MDQINSSEKVVEDQKQLKKSSPNPKGRPKGIRDRRAFRYDVWQKLVEFNHDPIENLIKIAENPTWDQPLRLRAEIELMDRIAPRLKQVEITADKVSSGFQLNIFYSKNEQQESTDPLNMVLNKIKPSIINQK